MDTRPEPSTSSLEAARDVLLRLSNRARAAIVGRDDIIELTLIALLADGHVLLEDYPGSGKTTLARCLGDALVDDGGMPGFRRVQFTPDLLPSDVTGTSIFELEGNRFSFRPGPVFAHIVLADEINRTSPKVQAALLEAMAEKQVTVDNQTHALDALFFVIATQNPLDVAGTYPLPSPQLDRFLFKLSMRHIEREAELGVLAQYPKRSLELGRDLPRVTRDELIAARNAVRDGVVIAPAMREALVDVARALRDDTRVVQGASTRSLVLCLPALQVRAVLRGRDYVSPEDLEALAPHVFNHRIECVPGVEDPRVVIAECMAPIVERLSRLSLRS